ncbi:hypothetical protein T4E_2479 [Trichinella pseudospiralis]|uniref:Uncharacterized protein n=1 Tax=Trichinella pseudospiralis TaxID=6337 RepID=A0A0V0YKR0_TRIPS|nr:hypothetical protein T4E_2479 [Trichinella pseudospiralis]
MKNLKNGISYSLTGEIQIKKQPGRTAYIKCILLLSTLHPNVKVSLEEDDKPNMKSGVNNLDLK